MKRDMQPLLWTSALLLAGAAWTHAHAAPPQLKPGLWEYKMTMEMAGMPKMPMVGQPMTFTRCLKPEDIKDPTKAFEDNKSKHQCEHKEHKVEGNKVSFKVVCSGENAGTGSGEFTIDAEKFDGTMKFAGTGGPMGGMEMMQTMSGRRLGDCK